MSDVHYTIVGDGPPLLLLHATLSSSRQLRSLATHLAGRHTVVSIDRRGSGRSATDDPPAPIDVATHIEDIATVAAAEALLPALVVGHSYGGCVALELAARRPELVSGVFAYEPPYGPLATPAVQEHMRAVAEQTLAAGGRGDLVGAALAFMAGVSGPDSVAALSPAARERIGRSGRGAVADATLLGMEPDGLAAIRCPVRIATGGDSEPLYADIADALVDTIAGASWVALPDLGHMAPILQPDTVATAVEALAGR